MGALAVLEDEFMPVIPSRLRLSDENPLTREPYSRSYFRDLPGHAQYVVTELVSLSPLDWNALVDAGEVYTVVGPMARFDVGPWFVKLARVLDRPASGRQCEDCAGTCVMLDWDGSVTGTVGAAVLCVCAGHV